jgi:SET domain-containing protein
MTTTDSALTTHAPPITVALTAERGRGVFATRDIAPDEVIETCPVIVVPADEADAVCSSVLGNYAYGWDDGAVVVALGFGSLYNHSADPNATYEEGEAEDTMLVRARRLILAGDEVFIDYTGGGEQELWFDAI